MFSGTHSAKDGLLRLIHVAETRLDNKQDYAGHNWNLSSAADVRMANGYVDRNGKRRKLKYTS